MNRVKFEWLQNHVDCTKINEVKNFKKIFSIYFLIYLDNYI
jgi:type III secretory pathway component EscU